MEIILAVSSSFECIRSVGLIICKFMREHLSAVGRSHVQPPEEYHVDEVKHQPNIVWPTVPEQAQVPHHLLKLVAL